MNKNKDIYFHGSIEDIQDSLNSPINWITKDFDYAKTFALDSGYVYTCKVSLGNLFDVGKTDNRVFDLLPIKPYKFSKEFNEIVTKLNIDEKIIRDLISNIAKNYQVNEYKLKIKLVVNTLAFKNILKGLGYNGIKAIEYDSINHKDVETYGIFDSVKIVDKESVKESLSEAKAITWGDLDYAKKTDTRNMMGGRGTGHFGTGFYFVGANGPYGLDGDKFYDYAPERPIYEIDLDKYKLFRPKDNEEAYKLHDAMRNINNYYSDDMYKFLFTNFDSKRIEDELYRLGNKALEVYEDLDDEFDDLDLDDFEDVASDLENSSKESQDARDVAYEKKYRELVLEFIKKYELDSWVPSYYNNSTESWLNNSKTGEIERGVEEAIKSKETYLHYVEHALKDLSRIFNVDKSKLLTLTKIFNKMNSDETISTLLFKELGYEGVDVTHLNKDAQGLSGLDNFSYGTVIYDLKPGTYKKIVEPRKSKNESLNESSGGNTFIFKGKKCWSGAVNTLDGTIEEVHSYKEAQEYDFHHSFYFSDEQIDKMEEGLSCFFMVFPDHTIMVNAMSRFNPEDRDIKLDEDFLKRRIKEQIKFISNEALNETAKYGNCNIFVRDNFKLGDTIISIFNVDEDGENYLEHAFLKRDDKFIDERGTFDSFDSIMKDYYYDALSEVVETKSIDEFIDSCRVLLEKIVKKGNKWQVQSEKGRNLGTYNTRKEAEKRLQQVHYFKHMNEDEDLNEFFDKIDKYSGTDILATDSAYQLKNLLEKGDKPYRIYYWRDVYYFCSALGDMTHNGMMQYLFDKGYADGKGFDEWSNNNYMVFIPKNFDANLMTYDTSLGSDDYYYCRVYDIGVMYVRDPYTYKNSLFEALGEPEREIFFNEYDMLVEITKNGKTTILDVRDINYDVSDAFTVKLDENLASKEEILSFVEKNIGTSDTPIDGPSYILPDGKFLTIWKSKIPVSKYSSSGSATHRDVQQYLYDNGLVKDDFWNCDDPDLERLGCIRVNSGFEEYIWLPDNRPNETQWNSLLTWLDWYFRFHHKLTVGFKHYAPKIYFGEEYTTDEILKKCKEAYGRGYLVEDKNENGDIDEGLKKLGETGILISSSPYEVKEKILHSKKSLKLVGFKVDGKETWLIGNPYGDTHADMINYANEFGYTSDERTKNVYLNVVPYNKELKFFVDYSTGMEYDYEENRIVDVTKEWSQMNTNSFEHTELYKALGEPNETKPYRYQDHIKIIKEFKEDLQDTNNEDKVLRLPKDATSKMIDALKDYYPGIHLEELPIDQLVKDNDLLNDDDLQSYHQGEWNHALAKDFHIDQDKVNNIKMSNSPFVIKKKDGRLLISDGRHRTRAAYNDGYTHVEYPTFVEE